VLLKNFFVVNLNNVMYVHIIICGDIVNKKEIMAQSCYNNTDRVMALLAKLVNIDVAYDTVRKENLKQQYHNYPFWDLAKRWDMVRISLDEGLCLAKAKTRFAKVSKGFNFLGYRITESGIVVSMSTGKRFRARLLRIHEQWGGLLALKQYMWHWFCCATTGAAVEKLQLLQKINTILHFKIRPSLLV